MGAIGTGVVSTVPGLLLLFSLTDVVGVGAGVAALVLLLPKPWDALPNPVVRTLSDRTSTRWGGRRPYLLAGAVVVPGPGAPPRAGGRTGTPDLVDRGSGIPAR